MIYPDIPEICVFPDALNCLLQPLARLDVNLEYKFLTLLCLLHKFKLMLEFYAAASYPSIPLLVLPVLVHVLIILSAVKHCNRLPTSLRFSSFSQF